MFKKLFAAALCGIVIASIASHADAAGPGGFARGFATIERNALASLTSPTETDKVDLERKNTLSALDHYLDGFDQRQQD